MKADTKQIFLNNRDWQRIVISRIVQSKGISL